MVGDLSDTTSDIVERLNSLIAEVEAFKFLHQRIG